MKTATTPPATVSAFSPTINQEFIIKGNSLHIPNLETKDLYAYRWDAPGSVPVFFIFAENDVHIITLDSGETAFNWVYSKNQDIAVIPVSDEEIVMFAEQTECILSLKIHGHA